MVGVILLDMQRDDLHKSGGIMGNKERITFSFGSETIRRLRLFTEHADVSQSALAEDGVIRLLNKLEGEYRTVTEILDEHFGPRDPSPPTPQEDAGKSNPAFRIVPTPKRSEPGLPPSPGGSIKGEGAG